MGTLQSTSLTSPTTAKHLKQMPNVGHVKTDVLKKKRYTILHILGYPLYETRTETLKCSTAEEQWMPLGIQNTAAHFWSLQSISTWTATHFVSCWLCTPAK